jgi:glucosamine--fructose-6-phosphate aminotransferase (isomerizing)
MEINPTYNEIKSQTQAWNQALSLVSALDLPAAERYDRVIFTGCGSSYYLSLAAAALYQELTGHAARAVPGGELLLNSHASVGRAGKQRGQDTRQSHELLVAISRSGTTTETIKAVEKFKMEKRGEVAVFSNYQEVLSSLGDVNIIIEQGQEESIAQTRSFTSMYVAVTAYCVKMAGRDDLFSAMGGLINAAERLMTHYESHAKEIGENLFFDRFYFLGSGILYGLACEANLKMKEMTLTHSEPFHFLEFRHGPMSMVNNKAVLVGMLSDTNRIHEVKVLSEMKTLGGIVVSLGEHDADIEFNSRIPESIRGVLYLPFLQLMAFYRSLAKGLNPAKPQNLTAVVRLDF